MRRSHRRLGRVALPAICFVLLALATALMSTVHADRSGTAPDASAAKLAFSATTTAGTTSPVGAATTLGSTPAPAPAEAAANAEVRTLFPGLMLVALAGLVAIALRRQSRARPV